MLHLVTSNRFEALTDTLLARLDAQPMRSPLEPHVLAVASLAQRRALTMAIAQRHGVAMNLRFVFLAQWLWRQMAARVPGIAHDTPFDAATLAWRIDRLFADPDFVQRRPRLAPYLDACDEPMRFAFASRSAQLVEHLTTYRHDWLEHWSRGQAVPPPASLAADATMRRAWIDDEAWQRALWQRLEHDLGLPGEHPAGPFRRTLASDASVDGASTDTATIHVVALPSIAPLHLHLLAALARVIDVHLYAVNPSRAYWVDVASERRLAQLRARGSVLALHTQVGHPLLAAWGAQAQAQHALLQQHLDGDLVEDEVFVEPEGSTRLARMQRAILELDDAVTTRTNVGTGTDVDTDADADADTETDAHHTHDDSVEIHVAHSLRRELEAMQQRLLALFARPDAPQAHEVLLVTPDLDAAAPMIDAVFGAATGTSRIAYAITGRASGDDGGCAAALLELVDLGRGRWSAEDLDALVHLPLVAQRFGWDDDDLATLHDWIDTAGMRFALDAAHRRSLGLHDDDAWTLDDAVERLLLGHAMAADGAFSESIGWSTASSTTASANSSIDSSIDSSITHEGTAIPRLRAPLAGKLPAAKVGGAHAALLGGLAALHALLRPWRQRLEGAHTPADWQAHLLWAIEAFFAPTQAAEHEGLRALRLALAQWSARAHAADETRSLSATLMRLSLEQELRGRAAGAVPTGAVTFASMTGLRRLPYRVIVAFGLNDGAWGASGNGAEWDLMARAPRLGDRQRRADERDVLLDLMLAARDRFWITYTGRDPRGNHVLPPAAVVDEWLEALAAADGTTVGALRQQVVTEHPLQPFAAELFAPGAPATRRSHHAGYARALEARRAGQRGATPPPDHTPSTGATEAASPRADGLHDSGDLFVDESANEGTDESTDESTHEVDDTAAATPASLVDEDDTDGDADPALDGNEDATAFFARPLPPVPLTQRRITLDELKRFFANPARALLEQRLGIALPRAQEALRGDEPFALDPRDRATLARRLMPAMRAVADGGGADRFDDRIDDRGDDRGDDQHDDQHDDRGDDQSADRDDDHDHARALLAHAQATGLLPSAALGQAVAERELDALRRQAEHLAGGTMQHPEPLVLTVPTPDGPWQLVIDMSYFEHDGRTPWRAAKLAPKLRLEGWIEHLALAAIVDSDDGAPTRLVTRDRVASFAPVKRNEAVPLLRDLVRLMSVGLRAPLPFMPRLAWEAVQRKTARRGQAARDADDATQGDNLADTQGDDRRGDDERRDPWVLLAWRGRSLLDDPRFERLAHEVYDPLVACDRDEVEL